MKHIFVQILKKSEIECFCILILKIHNYVLTLKWTDIRMGCYVYNFPLSKNQIYIHGAFHDIYDQDRLFYIYEPK